MASSSEEARAEARAYCERIEQKQGVSRAKWGYLWPIALAPSIPLVALATK